MTTTFLVPNDLSSLSLPEDAEELDQALKKYGFASMQELNEHLAAVQERQAILATPQGFNELVARGRAVSGQIPEKRITKALDSAAKAKNRVQRVNWIRDAADSWAKVTSQASPCKSGCAACCYMPVMVSVFEAQVMAKQLNIKLARPGPEHVIGAHSFDDQSLEELDTAQQKISAKLMGTPCPFLKDSRCQAYASRPLACRTHFTGDIDALLCRLVPGQEIRTPMIDPGAIKSVVTQIEAEDIQEVAYADIRHWFPSR